MTTPTNKPVPSSDPRDLLFNAEKLDEVVNSGLPSYVDRLGATRDTVAGAVATMAAFNVRGDWTAGSNYDLKDLALNAGTWYACVIPHTAAAAFPTDLAAGRWVVHQGVVAADLASTASATKGAGMVGLSSDVPYPVGTVGERFAEYVSITEPRFGGAVGGSWHAAIQAASTFCTSKDISGDAGGPYGGVCLVIPKGTFPANADVEMPRNVLCHGQITGTGTLKFTRLKRGRMCGLRATNVLIDGLWFSTWSDCYIAALTIKGGGTGFGTFWNTFENLQAAVTIDLSNWSVNQNRFNGRGNFQTIGTTGTLLDGHANNTSNWDFTGGGCINSSTVQQDSLLLGSYYEAGADIDGPYHVIGAQGDASGPPRVKRRNHVLATFDVVERNRADFLAAGSRSILQGGEWDFLDINGKPHCLASTGGNTVVADATEPFGMKYKYGGSFTSAFTGFQITIPPCRSARFSLVVCYQGDDPASIEVQRGGGGGTSSGGASTVLIDGANIWKLLRVSGNASQTANTVVQIYALTAPGSKTIYIGGMFATQEKAALLPSAQIVREQQGTATQAYVNTGSFVDVAVTFPRPFATGTTPTVLFNVVNTAAQTPNFTKTLLQAVSNTGFTVRVYFATDWAGQINWNARGLD